MGLELFAVGVDIVDLKLNHPVVVLFHAHLREQRIFVHLIALLNVHCVSADVAGRNIGF